MIDKSWRDYFPSRILERGREYWRQGNVEELVWAGSSIQAVVLGSEEYDVELEIEDDIVVDLYCSCPYAEDGSACKHMAAVLFAAEADNLEPGDRRGLEPSGLTEFPWRETLAKLSLEDMRGFLEETIEKDKGLQERLVLRFQEQNPQMLLGAWEERLQEIVRRYSDGRRYISYVHADDFYNELDDFMLERAPDLLEGGNPMLAFALVCLVYETAMEQGADDSDGGLGMLTDTCEQFWNSILSAVGEDQQKEIHRWFAERLVMPSWCFGTDAVEDFLFSHPWTPALLKKNLEILDKMIPKQDASGYHLRGLLDWREATMRRLNCPKDEIDAFWYPYRDLPFVRDRMLRAYMDSRNYHQAVELLKEEKRRDAEEPWRLKRHSEKLIELYRILGQEQNYREELRFQVFSCQQQNMEYVRQLRSVLPAEAWPEMREKLLQAPTTRTLRLELLADDEQWQRLFEQLQKEGQLNSLDRYADRLIQWSPERVLACYERFLDAAMERASDRQLYRGVIGYLPRLRTCPGGNEAAQRLAARWRAQFPRKRAMLEELQYAGF